MNVPIVLRLVASLVTVAGLAMLTAVPVSWAMADDPAVTIQLAWCSFASIGVGIAVVVSTKKTVIFSVREGFAIVALGWLAVAVFGAMPLYIVEGLHWYDAFFETVSGFTTTGASVIGQGLSLRNGDVLDHGLADLSYGILYWRSLTHWLGGMGIVLLSLLVFPTLGIGSHQLYRAEVPGPTKDSMTPRIVDSAKILWVVYLLFSVLETVLLRLGGMSMFDAWTHTCGTLATGGFSTQQASIGAFNSLYFEAVIILFMFLAGINFILHYRLVQGKPLAYYRDEEFRFYTLFIVVAVVTVTLSLRGETIVSSAGVEYADAGFFTALRFSAFQVISIITTTGFVTADFNLWPAYPVLLLICLMFIGGCGGSTGGGMKQSRLLLLIKYGFSQIERCLFRRSVSNIRLNGQRIDTLILHKTLAFFFIFIMIFIIISLLMTLLGVDDLVTAASASIAALGNIGPGLSHVGATETYAWMQPSAKLLLGFAMVLGRLELYTVLVLFIPAMYYRGNR